MKDAMKLIYLFKLKHNDKISCERIEENTWRLVLTDRWRPNQAQTTGNLVFILSSDGVKWW